MPDIAQNLRNIKEKMRTSAARMGRDPSKIKLIAVSKTKPLSCILEALEAGQMAFGENYAQELRDKNKEILTLSPPSPIRGEGDKATKPSVEWHFVGHLQKNKLKYVLPVARWIHSVDSVELLKEMNEWLACHPLTGDRHAPLRGARDDTLINCLIEVNIGAEESKTGTTKETLIEIVKAFAAVDRSVLRLRGLMCIPPNFDDAEKNRPHFKELKDLLEEINSLNIYPEKLTELSMGMTNDFEVAIEEGATMVRVGTAIFGERG